MIGRRIYITAALTLLMQGVQAQMKADDFLKADGKVLRNNSGMGNIVNLRGTNLGSWLSLENWIGPAGFVALNRPQWSYHTIENADTLSLPQLGDNKPTSSWQLHSSQERTLLIDMKAPVIFDDIQLQSPTPVSIGKPVLLLTSQNGTSWDTIHNPRTDSARNAIQLDTKEARFILLKWKPASDITISEVRINMEDDFTIRNTLIRKLGVEKTDRLLDEYQQIWITTADLDTIKAMGLNMIRVPVFWMELMDNKGKMKSNAFQQLDWVIRECNKRRLYVIIDLHGAPGGLDSYITSGQAITNEIWSVPQWREWTAVIWKAIATRYKGNPTVAAYDLLNEPVSNRDTFRTKDLYAMLYKVVRAADTNHLISMGAFYNFDFLGAPAANGWTNVIYQAHYYNTDIHNKPSQEGFLSYALKDMETHQQEWNVPVYAGEYTFWHHMDIWAKWMGGLNKINASWSNWCYKNRVTQPDGWSFYQVNTHPVPDLLTDDYATIVSKWKLFTTSHFRVNKALIEVVKEYANQ